MSCVVTKRIGATEINMNSDTREPVGIYSPVLATNCSILQQSSPTMPCISSANCQHYIVLQNLEAVWCLCLSIIIVTILL